jgi:urea transport system substrate-binding protein
VPHQIYSLAPTAKMTPVHPLIIALCAALICAPVAQAAADTIKVGILHSLTGTLGGSETPLKDVMLMLINQTNAKGGLLGKQIEPVVVDGKSNWPLFAQLARQLISEDKVAVVFGCWTSVSRKSVLTVFEELNHLLFYPVQYEGEECSKNVFYTGAVRLRVDFLASSVWNREFSLTFILSTPGTKSASDSRR